MQRRLTPAPLPMRCPAGHPDAWHQVTAPGGYEQWYFDAEGDDGRTLVIARFFEGCPFHPAYLRRYARYRRRPSQVAPPVPRDCPGVEWAVYREGQPPVRRLVLYPPEAFRADAERPDVTIGPNRLSCDAEGVYHLEVLDTRLSFRPTLPHAPVQWRYLSSEASGAEHDWILAAPRCAVSGTIALPGEAPIAFAGRGYHDHTFGTGPLGPGHRWLMRGWMLTDTGAVAFHVARPSRPDLPTEGHIHEADAAGVSDVDAAPQLESWRRSRWALPYPGRIDFGEPLQLTHPRILEATPFSLRLKYDAVSRGRAGRAVCDIIHPHHLRHPLLGRMIERRMPRLSTFSA